MSRFALVAVGYNRIPGILRLLRSLASADYDEPVDLIISLDNCGKPDVENAVADLDWKYGQKIVRTFPERQGLRKHILSCGDYLKQYDAIAVFEDDIVVSPAFFAYMKQCVEFYSDCDDVAGISLYSHKLNVNVNLPFEPEPGEKDVYLMKFAQSWGQVWMKKQWFSFRKWIDKNIGKPLEAADTPRLICNWSDSSWLKYHIKYCIEAGKYFVYPYHSLTTCFSDVGEHCKKENDYFQVALMSPGRKNYLLGRVDDPSVVKYDAFFEREGLENKIGIPAGELCTDIYGAKNNREGKRYWLTRRAAPYETVKQFALNMRPQECNVIYDVAGKEIFLYDTGHSAKLVKKDSLSVSCKTVSYYYNVAAEWKMLVRYLLAKMKKRLKR